MRTGTVLRLSGEIDLDIVARGEDAPETTTVWFELDRLAAQPVPNAGVFGARNARVPMTPDAIHDQRPASRWSEKIDGAVRRAPSPLLVGPHVNSR